jgi:hypothetical protein
MNEPMNQIDTVQNENLIISAQPNCWENVFIALLERRRQLFLEQWLPALAEILNDLGRL